MTKSLLLSPIELEYATINITLAQDHIGSQYQYQIYIDDINVTNQYWVATTDRSATITVRVGAPIVLKYVTDVSTTRKWTYMEIADGEDVLVITKDSNPDNPSLTIIGFKPIEYTLIMVKCT